MKLDPTSIMKFALAAVLALVTVSPASAGTLVRSSLVELGQSVPYEGGTREILDFNGYCVATNGDVYFSARVTGDGAGVWKIDQNGISEVLNAGTPIADNPGETWNGNFSNLAANASGKLILFGLNNSNEAVVGTYQNGVGHRLASDGDPAPPVSDALNFTAFSDVWINDEGTVAFTGNARGANPNVGVHPGVWIDRGNGLNLLVLGEVDSGKILFDLANGDLVTYVKIEEGGSSGIFSIQGVEDKELRLSMGAKTFDGQNDYFLADLRRLAINATGKLAFHSFLVDDKDEPASYPTLTGQLPDLGLLEETDPLFSEEGFFGTPLAVNARGSVLVAVEAIDSDDGFSLRLYRADGTVAPILLDAEVIPGFAVGEEVLGYDAVHGMLDDKDGVVVLLATENTEVLLRAAFESRVPEVRVTGPARRTVRSSKISLRGTVVAESRTRVEVRMGSRLVNQARVNAPGTRWTSGRLALRPGRNPFIVSAVDADGLRSSFVRVLVIRRK
jgi:hypothetical protein